MKFPNLTPNAEKEYTADFLAKGLDLTGKGGMKHCRNMMYKDGQLKTRPGFYDTDQSVPLPAVGSMIVRNLTFTDITVMADGDRWRLAYDMIWNAFGSAVIRVFLINDAGELCDCGEMNYYRTSADIFYVPESVVFIQASPTSGSGIYAFVRACCAGEADMYSVYEAAEDYTEWSTVEEECFYVPTIYINGRGNRYDAARHAQTAYEEDPATPESLNLISGKFRAFFSSDGLSTTFQLPIARLDDTDILCRVYETPTVYSEWTITAGHTSVKASHSGVQITLSCNRTTGTLRFLNGTTDYPISKMSGYDGNNILIEASHTIADGKASVFGSVCAAAFSEHIFVGGSENRPGTVCYARRSRPFYFPEDSLVCVGDDAKRITALVPFDGTLLAFKEDQIYRLDASGGRQKSINQNLITDGTYVIGDTLRVRQLNGQIGCTVPETLCAVGDRLMWARQNGSVYVMTTAAPTGTPAYTAAREIAAVLSEFLPEAVLVCAAGRGNEYLLCADCHAFYFDGNAWYEWLFPSDIRVVSAAVLNEKWQITYVPSGNNDMCCTAVLTGNTDRTFAWEDGIFIIKETPVAYSFASGPLYFDRPNVNKSVDALYITGGALNTFFVHCGADFRADARFCDAEITAGRTKTWYFRPGVYHQPSVSVSVRGEAPAYFSGIRFGYRHLSEVGFPCVKD